MRCTEKKLLIFKKHLSVSLLKLCELCGLDGFAITSAIKNMKTRSFKDLIVWQKAYNLVVEIYKITRGFPKDEIYGLVYLNR